MILTDLITISALYKLCLITFEQIKILSVATPPCLLFRQFTYLNKSFLKSVWRTDFHLICPSQNCRFSVYCLLFFISVSLCLSDGFYSKFPELEELLQDLLLASELTKLNCPETVVTDP